MARTHRPQLAQQRALTRAARGRSLQALAGMLPSVEGVGNYQRTTSNFTLRPGLLPTGITIPTTTPSWNTFNYWTFGASASMLLWDFGSTYGRYRQASEAAVAQAETEIATEHTVIADVETAYVSAWAARALVKVARDTLANQERHLQQVQAFVAAGTRPEIDLAQTRADVANAQVLTIRAENNHATSLAELALAMGLDESFDFDVADETVAPIAGETHAAATLLAEALATRPDLRSAVSQTRAARLAVDTVYGTFGPAVTAQTAVTDAGAAIDDLTWNWSATVNLTWPVFEGGLRVGQLREARGNASAAAAVERQLRQQIRFEVVQARLGVSAASAALLAARDGTTAAAEQLRLAEGRYQTGVGNIIELGDAQVAYTTAAAQQVQASSLLAIARIALAKAVGRPFLPAPSAGRP